MPLGEGIYVHPKLPPGERIDATRQQILDDFNTALMGCYAAQQAAIQGKEEVGKYTKRSKIAKITLGIPGLLLGVLGGTLSQALGGDETKKKTLSDVSAIVTGVLAGIVTTLELVEGQFGVGKASKALTKLQKKYIRKFQLARSVRLKFLRKIKEANNEMGEDKARIYREAFDDLLKQTKEVKCLYGDDDDIDDSSVRAAIERWMKKAKRTSTGKSSVQEGTLTPTFE